MKKTTTLLQNRYYVVAEKPVLATWMQGGLDYIILRSLDTYGIHIIRSVLGQSIELDYFIHQVDHMVQEFVEINRTMEKSGTFAMERKKIFQLVGTENSNLAGVIIKLGFLDRTALTTPLASMRFLPRMKQSYQHCKSSTSSTRMRRSDCNWKPKNFQ